MNIMPQLLPVLGQVLLLSVLLAIFAGKWIKDARKRNITVVVLLVMCLFVPLNGLSVAQWLRSVFGDFSVITLVIFAKIAAQRLFSFNILNPDASNYLLHGLVLLGVVFYPLALGWGPFDPYSSGFAPFWLIVLLSLVSLASWFTGMRDLAIVLLLPVIAFHLRLLESANFWDYLLDPLLFGYAVVQVVTGRYRQL